MGSAALFSSHLHDTQTHMKTRLGMNPRSTEPEKTYEVNTTQTQQVEDVEDTW